ncbi:MAG: ribonuclease HIII [Bacilli bacterium]|nr:ribonuclease HIII [Bacilli bacterium]
MANSVTILADDSLIAKMANLYAGTLDFESNPNALWIAKQEDVVITAYSKTHNGFHKVLFQGEKAEYEASIWGSPQEPKTKNEATPVSKFPQIGSDEVGTGDFFGPICVCAAYVDKESLKLLKELGVTDSKKMTDAHILEIGPTLINKIPYSQLSLGNEKYNEVVRKGLNMNSIKAKMHNQCLLNLKAKYPNSFVYQDQFAEPSLYYSYLKNEPKILRGIEFSTKGELAFPSVAAGSVIARYSFLRKMKSLGEEYGVEIPFGAGTAVDEFAKEFAEKHGLEALKSITKSNFANMKRILEDQDSSIKLI